MYFFTRKEETHGQVQYVKTSLLYELLVDTLRIKEMARPWCTLVCTCCTARSRAPTKLLLYFEIQHNKKRINHTGTYYRTAPSNQQQRRRRDGVQGGRINDGNHRNIMSVISRVDLKGVSVVYEPSVPTLEGKLEIRMDFA